MKTAGVPHTFAVLCGPSAFNDLFRDVLGDVGFPLERILVAKKLVHGAVPTLLDGTPQPLHQYFDGPAYSFVWAIDANGLRPGPAGALNMGVLILELLSWSSDIRRRFVITTNMTDEGSETGYFAEFFEKLLRVFPEITILPSLKEVGRFFGDFYGLEGRVRVSVAAGVLNL